MSALPSEKDVRSARAVTEAEWRALRLESLSAGVPSHATPDKILIPYQQKLLATTAHYRVTVVEKSRRTGATWGVGALAVLTSGSAREAGGMDSLYIGYNLDMAREFIDCCAMWARSFDQVLVGELDEFLFDDGPDKAISAFRIRFASGFEIVALASRPRSLRGRQGFVIIDEAAFHDDLKELMKAALALLIWGGKVLVISTHNGEDNYYNTLVKEARAGTKGYGFVRFDFDDALKDGLYQRVCLRTGEEWSIDNEAAWRAGIIREYGDAADEELFCIPSEGSGTWLPGPLIEARAKQGIPVKRLSVPQGFTFWADHHRRAFINDWCARELLPILKNLDPLLTHFMGGDYGRVSDLTVLWPLAIQRTLRRATPFVVEMRATPFDCQRQVQDYIFERLPRFCGFFGDATGLGFALAEAAQQKLGELRAQAVMLNVPWYRENSEPLKTAFEDDMIEIPADAEIFTDLRLVQVKAGVPFMPALKSGVSKDRHGDSAVALMLAYAATRAPLISYDYQSVQTLRDSEGEENDDDGLHDPRGLY
ncbi:terminase large subunit domain-containing protein [Rhodoblastus sp.]|uniref:terminase large subunit domain-containing protein n=1 Tax=Rhodoblastus sp. TaxID=1962975 RepID=UPI003F9A87EE